jgi:hypothetical protein
MEEANSKGGGFGWAVQVCDVYELNGFDDWFLPTRDELNYMYGNLHMRGLGDFQNAEYWSCLLTQASWQDGDSAWYINFADGKAGNSYVNRFKYRVRPIRQFQ